MEVVAEVPMAVVAEVPMAAVAAVPKGLQCSVAVLMTVGASPGCPSVCPLVSVRWSRAKPLRAGISSRQS